MKDLNQANRQSESSLFLEAPDERNLSGDTQHINQPDGFSKMAFRKIKSTSWICITIGISVCFLVILIGTALILGTHASEDGHVDVNCSHMATVCSSRARTPSSRLTPGSPLYTPPTPSVEGMYRYGAVASDSPPCSSVGSDIMFRHGGSAIDAAIAALLCAGVYNSQSSGIGGGFIMTYYERATESKHTIMSRETAPGESFETMFQQDGWDSLEGAKSVAVPGEVKGLYEAWRLGGKLPWGVLFQPAIQMCVDGFKVGPALAQDIQRTKHHLDTHVELNIEKIIVVLRQMVTNPKTKGLYKEGDDIKLPKLGATLQKIAADPFTFYNGSLAGDIVKDLGDFGGIIRTEDLKNYKTAVKEALIVNLDSGYTVMSPPPPSSGAVLLLILNILNGFQFSEDSISTAPKAVQTYHRIVEAFKHGFSVRTLLGDPDTENQEFIDSLDTLLANITSPTFGEERRGLITDRTHDMHYYNPLHSVNASDTGTTHISVLAPNGDAVSVTSTVNLWFGSKVVGHRTGIVFNNEMDDFSTPNTTNFFGLSASAANFIKAGKRPMSSMSPAIVVNSTSGDVYLVVGASGGTQILTSTAFVILEILSFKLGVKEAVDMPKFHHQLLPEELLVEKDFQKFLLDGLKERGHTFSSTGELYSTVQAVLRNKQGDIHANCDYEKYGAPDGA